MGFGGFQLFTDISSYLNTASLAAGAIDSVLSNDTPADLFYGLSAANGGVVSLLQKRPAQHGFIVDTVTRERLIFQYNVKTVESGGANYSAQEVLARSIPRFHYKGGRERTLELPLVFTMQEKSREDIRRSVRFLQSLAYPDYSSSGELSEAPHPVVVVQGKLYSQDIWLVRDFQIRWGDALDPVSQLPSEVLVNLTLIEIRNKARSYREVIRL